MSTHLTKTGTTSVASIEIKDSAIAKGIITVDLHKANSVHDQAVYQCFDDMLLSGTKTHTRTQLLNEINQSGSEIAVNINDGFLTMEITSTEKAWSKMLKLSRAILTDSVFPQSELKRVKKLAISDLENEKEDAMLQALLHLKSELYPAGNRRAGALETTLIKTIKKLTSKDLKQLYGRMQASSITASVTGSAQVCTSFSKLISAIAPANVTGVRPSKIGPVLAAKRLVHTDIPSRDNIDLSIGCTVPLRPGAPGYAALSFGIAVLAKYGGFSGRMMSIVREKEGLTYSIYGRMQGCTISEDGYFRLYTFFNPNQIKQGITSTFREFKKIAKAGITETEHASFKSILATQSILQNDSPIARIRVLHEFNKLGFSIEDIKVFEKEFQTVTRKEINAALKKYLNPDTLTISAAGPTKAIQKELRRLVNKL